MCSSDLTNCLRQFKKEYYKNLPDREKKEYDMVQKPNILDGLKEIHIFRPRFKDKDVLVNTFKNTDPKVFDTVEKQQILKGGNIISSISDNKNEIIESTNDVELDLINEETNEETNEESNEESNEGSNEENDNGDNNDNDNGDNNV